MTGIDGKSYNQKPRAGEKPPERKQKRRPLSDAFFEAVYDTGKKVESLHRLTQDDRFPQNAEKIAEVRLSDLLRTQDLLQQVITSLKEKHTHG